MLNEYNSDARWIHCETCQLTVDKQAHPNCQIFMGWVSKRWVDTWTDNFWNDVECMRCHKEGLPSRDIILWSDDIQICEECLHQLGVKKASGCEDMQDYRYWCMDCLRDNGFVQRPLELHPTKCWKCQDDLFFYRHEICIATMYNQTGAGIEKWTRYFCRKCVLGENEVANQIVSMPEEQLCQRHSLPKDLQSSQQNISTNDPELESWITVPDPEFEPWITGPEQNPFWDDWILFHQDAREEECEEEARALPLTFQDLPKYQKKANNWKRVAKAL